ncbi:beta-class carbonic anhydrase [Streptococcus tangpeifui]|uniref:beta-class carbonic anhydrase n=1 Tax=Streptococcus tangpeifui TaxID=2709400 RepID=UPI0013EB9F33|nr:MULTISPECIES: carbonic anhydrase [unclassified Streptococcus]
MSYFENFIKANQAYIDRHGTAHLPIKPKTKVAIITCMDARLHVAPALGLDLGDAHILRNAGGRVTEDMIRSLVISQQQLGTQEVVVLHHTDCGAQTFKNADFVADLEERFQVNLQDKNFLPFTDVEESVRQDVALLKDSPLIPDDITIFGAIYDVDTGRISPVQ